jgi:hypothetical protein
MEKSKNVKELVLEGCKEQFIHEPVILIAAQNVILAPCEL